MKYNPKVVPFDRSAAYVHHRAMKNRRDNNPLDALELLRHAVEHSPENVEYQLDLAELYCEMGCHELSNRILLDLLAEPGAPAECYYGLALNQYAKDELESAERALDLYACYSESDEYNADIVELQSDIAFERIMGRRETRRQKRAKRVARRAGILLGADDAEGACRLYERSLSYDENQAEVRAIYAMALQLCGRDEDALTEAEKSVAAEDASVRALCTAAQVMKLCGRDEDALALARRAIAQKPQEVELRLLIFSLCELEMYDEAAEAARLALRETPYSREMLHLRAVVMLRAGATDEQVQPFWDRILRIDPSDSVAAFYRDAAKAGTLDKNRPELMYEVPVAEARRRLLRIAGGLAKGLPEVIRLWREDRSFRECLIWAANRGDEDSGRAAVAVIAMADDAESESVLRALFYRSNVPVEVKAHALRYLQMRGANMRRVLPPDSDGVLLEAKELLSDRPVGERRLVNYASEMFLMEEGLHFERNLAVLWLRYKLGCIRGVDPMVSTGEAAAALLVNFQMQRNRKISLADLEERFGCRRRRTAYYARYMAAVLKRSEGAMKGEDH